MYRTLLALTLSIAAISLPASATGTSKANVTLTGVVGPGFNISLKNPDGSSVSHLDPGTYDVAVTDNAPIDHNFHLRGPGVDMATLLEGSGTVTWTVTFTDGTYTYLCDAHPTQMKGSFTVGVVQQPPPPPAPGKLSGRVTARSISLKTSSGSKVRSIAAKKYKVTVSDTSNKQNFHLRGPGVNKKTGVVAKSKATWTLTLRPGKYTYRSDKSRKLGGSFRVTAP
jgi:plastocyanin